MIPARFSRGTRLGKPRDYRRVFQKPYKSSDKFLTVLARANGRSGPRLGLAIARKRLPRAVDRNRVKRVVRESFRRHQGLLNGLDLVVLANSGARAGHNQQLTRSLEQHWRRVAVQQRAENDKGANE